MMYRVLIPTDRPQNTFFEDVIKHSNWQFEYGTLETPIHGYSVVLIQWPEQLFDWYEPNEAQLKGLKLRFESWRQSLKIVYVMHNEKRHYGMTDRFKALYELVLAYCDGIVHLGQYSLSQYEPLYPDKEHVVIPHPLYGAPFKLYDKSNAREQLGISASKKVVIIPGAIRSIAEREFVLKAFKSLKLKNKLLVVPNMHYKSIPIEFPMRYRLKRVFDVKAILEYFNNLEYHVKYRFGYGFTSPDKLSLLMSAADVVFIPRMDTLNSGIVFLGMTFNKVVVGPGVGNILEVLNSLNLPVFDPSENKSVRNALAAGFKLQEADFVYEKQALDRYKPSHIAKQWDEFLERLCSDTL